MAHHTNRGEKVFSGGSRVQTDFNRLCERMEQRLYPETMQALGLYWLKTLWNKEYTRDEWSALDDLLQERLASEAEPEYRQALLDLRTWTRDASAQSNQTARGYGHSTLDWQRRPLDAETLIPYVVRLVNEWLPVEVARLLIADQETGGEPHSGIPATATGRALERLLRRERLTAPTLEAMLQPGLLSPRLIYPADYEILRDVVLYLLGRTEAPASPILPAALLFIAPGAHLSSDYARAVERAALVQGPETEELHVPIAPAQAMEALAGVHIRITSRVVTMDGQWWEAGKLKGGREQNVIVYRPAGRVRIDYTGDHARIPIPWPEARYRWTGLAHFGPVVNIFGREWHMGQWEQDADHTWVHLVFSRCLSPGEMGIEARPRRAQPASVDLAWAALADALSSCLRERQPDALESLRHEEMIPLARSILALLEAARDAKLRKPATIEARLRAVGFFATAVKASYGPVRWRVLPEGIRKILLAPPLYPALSECLHEVFEGLPDVLRARAGRPRPSHWLRQLVSGRNAAQVS